MKRGRGAEGACLVAGIQPCQVSGAWHYHQSVVILCESVRGEQLLTTTWLSVVNRQARPSRQRMSRQGTLRLTRHIHTDTDNNINHLHASQPASYAALSAAIFNRNNSWSDEPLSHQLVTGLYSIETSAIRSTSCLTLEWSRFAVELNLSEIWPKPCEGHQPLWRSDAVTERLSQTGVALTHCSEAARLHCIQRRHSFFS